MSSVLSDKRSLLLLASACTTAFKIQNNIKFLTRNNIFKIFKTMSSVGHYLNQLMLRSIKSLSEHNAN